MLGTRTWGGRMVGYGGIPSDLLGQVFPTTQDFNMVENVILNPGHGYKTLNLQSFVTF